MNSGYLYMGTLFLLRKLFKIFQSERTDTRMNIIEYPNE